MSLEDELLPLLLLLLLLLPPPSLSCRDDGGPLAREPQPESRQTRWRGGHRIGRTALVLCERWVGSREVVTSTGSCCAGEALVTLERLFGDPLSVSSWRRSGVSTRSGDSSRERMRGSARRSFGIKSISTAQPSSTAPDEPPVSRYWCTCRTCSRDEKRTQSRKSWMSSRIVLISC